MFGRNEDLVAVLAGVAGPRNGDARRGHFAVREPVVANLAQVDAGQRLQHLASGRALDRDQRVRLLESTTAASPAALTCSLIQAKSLAVFAALTTSMKWLGAMR